MVGSISAAKELCMPYQPETGANDEHSPIISVYRAALPAQEFRVLNLGEYDAQGVLQCTISDEKIGDESLAPYTAISYTWDEKERIWYGEYDKSPKPMIINDTRVLLSDKVANILSLMQQRDYRRVWIDAICINQEDDVEKSVQVSQMGSIYGSASTVISVLGSPSEDTDLGLDPDRWFASGWPVAERYKAARGLEFLMLINAYWTRTWVLQEMAFAQTALLSCGTRLVTMDALSDFCGRLNVALNSVSEHVRLTTQGLRTQGVGSWLSKAKKQFNETAEGKKPERAYEVGNEKRFRGLDFLSILDQSRRFHGCSNPSDVLYSKLALASDSTKLIAKVDYSVHVVDLFQSFATNCICSTGSLEVITFAQHTSMNIPTWVPDWSTARDRWNDEPMCDTSDHVSMEINQQSMSAVTWDAETPDAQVDGRTLIAYGRVLFTIPKDWISFRKLKQSVFNISLLKDEYHESETPEPGDVVVMLKNCPLFVYLHPVGDHFKVVGRNSRWQIHHTNGMLDEWLWSYTTMHEGYSGDKYGVKEQQYRWRFRDEALPRLRAIEPQAFRIH